MKTALRILLALLIAITITVGLVLGMGALEVRFELKKDEAAKVELLEHAQKCDGKCHAISVARAYFENPRYTYTCDECGSIFMFYDNSIPQEVLYAKEEN